MTHRSTTLLLALLAPIACSDSATAPTTPEGTGVLRIETFTAGPSVDADGYIVTLDGAESNTVGANDSLELTGVPVGEHTVELSGVAENCALDSQASQTGTVLADDTRTFPFYLWCTAPIPDEAEIVFTGGATFASDVNALHPDGTVTSIIQGVPGIQAWGFRDAAWSPDGNALLVVRHQPGFDNGVIWRLAADGSRIDRVTTGRRPSWSPDAQRISFIDFLDNSLHVVNIDGSSVESVPLDHPIHYAEWSPDDNRLVVEFAVGSGSSPGRKVAVVDIDGSVLHWIGGAASSGRRHPTWSPDGESVSYRRVCDGSDCAPGWGLWMTPSDGAGPEVPLVEGPDPIDPEWSPDGSQIMFTQTPSLVFVGTDGSGMSHNQALSDHLGAATWRAGSR